MKKILFLFSAIVVMFSCTSELDNENLPAQNGVKSSNLPLNDIVEVAIGMKFYGTNNTQPGIYFNFGGLPGSGYLGEYFEFANGWMFTEPNIQSPGFKQIELFYDEEEADKVKGMGWSDAEVISLWLAPEFRSIGGNGLKIFKFTSWSAHNAKRLDLSEVMFKIRETEYGGAEDVIVPCDKLIPYSYNNEPIIYHSEKNTYHFYIESNSLVR